MWHRDQADETQLKKLLEDHHKWTGSQRAREFLDNWAQARLKFVKVFPNEYKRALGEINARKAAAKSTDTVATVSVDLAAALRALISPKARLYSFGKTLTNFKRACAQLSRNSRARWLPVHLWWSSSSFFNCVSSA